MIHSVITFPLKTRVLEARITKVPSYARKLAASLMWTLEIQEGLALVYIIGHGDEYSNQRAIESWLVTHYSEEEVHAMASPLNTLESALVRHINDYHYNLEALPC